MDSPASRERTLPIALALVVLVAYAVHLGQWTFLCDDAYIAFRYAENLADHGELAYNVAPLERVEGYSNPLWVIALGLAASVGLPVPATALVLCAAAGAATLALVVALGATWAPNRRLTHAFAPALLLVLAPEFVVWGSGGLETMSVVALGFGAWLAVERGRWTTSAALASAAVLTRADAVLWLAPLLMLRAFAGGSLGAKQRPDTRQVVIAGLVLVVPVLVHLLWRHAYYGQWSPHTWTIKAHGSGLRSSFGTAYVSSWALAVGAPALIVLVAGWRARHLAPIVAALAMVGWAWSVGGDFMAYSRFLLPATVLVAFAAGDAWAEAVGGPRASRLVMLVLGASLLLGGSVIAKRRVARDGERAWLDGRFETVRAMDRFAAERVAAGRAFARQMPPDTRVIVGAAGAMPWASRLPTWDAYGLVDPGALEGARIRTDDRARPGHQVTVSPAYLRDRSPDLLCHVGAVATRPPPRREAARRGGPGAVWECVETGSLPERIRGDRSNRYYCCVRPMPASARLSSLPSPPLIAP